MIHIYTGNGKGKTTAAFGLAMRASGQNLKVIIYQFLKPKSFLSGEQICAKNIKNIKLVNFSHGHPIFRASRISSAELKKSIKKDFQKTRKDILCGRYDMVVLDEIINVVDQNFISRESFLQLLKSVPQKVELIITGRGDISDIEQYADYITIMLDKKHPFSLNKLARKGIEY